MVLIGVATGLKITAIRNQKAGAQSTNDEWVRLENAGSQRWNLAGWLITDETDRQINPHIYPLPERLTDSSTWALDPGEALYLRTGHGKDVFIANPSKGMPQFHFY